jgi:hypothetical protein
MHRRAYLLIKWTLVILYAVLIRQLVICPCFAAKFLTTRRTLFSHDSAASMGAANSALEYDAKSYAGDVVLVALLCFHLGLLIFGIYLATESTLEEDTEVLVNTAVQEVGAVFHWFPRFFPISLLLHPLHRYQWYHPGATTKEAFHATYVPAFRRCRFCQCHCYCCDEEGTGYGGTARWQVSK